MGSETYKTKLEGSMKVVYNNPRIILSSDRS